LPKVPPWLAPAEISVDCCGALPWLSPLVGPDVPAFPLIAALFDSAAANDALFCQGVLGERYRRLQVCLKREVALDECDAKQIQKLTDVVDAYFRSERWAEAKRWFLGAVPSE
jgi:hypothetical protein